MAEITVAILGLGRVGVSFVEALVRYNNTPDARNHFNLRVYDTRQNVVRQMKKRGLPVEVRNLPHLAVDNVDIVITAAPYSETRRVFREMSEGLRDGAVVFDLSPLKTPPIQWAAETFPPEVYLVGGLAVINPAYLWDGLDDLNHAAPDLFDDGSFLLAPTAGVAQDAVELVTQLINLIGSHIHFVDPTELDGLTTSTESLPALLGLVAFRTIKGQKGWMEAQRTTNPNFGRLTHHILDTHPDDLRDLFMDNRQNLIHQLDLLLNTLTEFKEVLEANDRDTVEAVLVDAETRYKQWLARRTDGKWDPTLSEESGMAEGSILHGFLGSYLADRLLGKDKPDD